jgi:2-polyprenyl-3-methyl-5-hydroxy-6-metoxy-1,4-benzoquinol methylase
MTIDFYDNRSAEWVRETAKVDMSSIYDRFLPLVEPGGRILDVGCGPGRDTLAFIRAGYQVDAIDASRHMVEIASRRTGQPAQLLRVEELDCHDRYHGIWACASLLHLDDFALGEAMPKLVQAMKADGALYMSFKIGDGTRIEQGRFFNDKTPKSLSTLVAPLRGMRILNVWESSDLRADGNQPDWVNCLAIRENADT